MSQTASLKEIYGLLYAGQRIKLRFSSKAEAEAFRVRLAQFKMLQERAAVSLGMISEQERQRFVFRFDSETGIAVLKFDERPDERQYSIIVEQDEGDGENGETT